MRKRTGVRKGGSSKLSSSHLQEHSPETITSNRKLRFLEYMLQRAKADPEFGGKLKDIVDMFQEIEK